MIERSLVCTKASLDAYLSAVRSGPEVGHFAVPEEAKDLVTRVETDSAVFLVHASDSLDSSRIVFAHREGLALLPNDGATIHTALQRASRLALSASTLPVRLPPAWSGYHEGNLIAFFAGPRELGSLRWIAQLRPADSEDVYLCRVTSSAEPVVLQKFSPGAKEYRSATGDWANAFEQAEKRFAHRRKRPAEHVIATVDLEATTFGAVTGDRTYSAWQPLLTKEQLAFLERPKEHSTKLRGAAGTGKTLLLALKALRETYVADSSEVRPRILFATHSWSVAEQVDAMLHRLHDGPYDIDRISVFPLLSMAQDLLPLERQGRGVELLGEDNLSGKAFQLDLIAEIVEEVVSRDWLAYEDRCSDEFEARAAAPFESDERKALTWDLMYEFACVLSANGILPGVNAAPRYLTLPRMPWMMRLETDGEKLFVLEVYTVLVSRLRDKGLLTSDQVVNDFLNYLETFAWNLRRAEDGYDLIFVDELHLFNEQERLALNFMSRDAGAHPVMFMALDPRQSPAESYAGHGVAVHEATSGEADALLGEIDALDLTTVHRFSPEILELVRHVNRSYPALDLGNDWDLDATRLETTAAPTGLLPTVEVHTDHSVEVAAVATDVTSKLSSASHDERVAVLLLDPLAVSRYQTLDLKAAAIQLLTGRDDVASLQYSKRAVVLSPAEYVAGLQFTHVVVAGFPPEAQRRVNVGPETRRLLSLIYLAASRATTTVSIHVNLADGGVPEVLADAIGKGILTGR